MRSAKNMRKKKRLYVTRFFTVANIRLTASPTMRRVIADIAKSKSTTTANEIPTIRKYAALKLKSALKSVSKV